MSRRGRRAEQGKRWVVGFLGFAHSFCFGFGWATAHLEETSFSGKLINQKLNTRFINVIVTIFNIT